MGWELWNTPCSDCNPVTATVLICTYNRAQRLAETLDSLGAQEDTRTAWDVLVVDNNSSDDTADVLRSRAASFPVPLRYLVEKRQGKSYALNAGLSAIRTDIVLFTDDDVRLSPAWIRVAVDALAEDPNVDYVGGPVRPIWGAPPPSWFPRTSNNLWGTVAVLDYGPSAFEFESRQRIPIGANMAVRRRLIDQAGGFTTALDRSGTALLGQGQAEFFYRTRQVGARGKYLPAMVVHHHVPASRLTKRYFRRWWWWKGVSRSRLHALHPHTETGVPLSGAPRIAGVPRFVYRELAQHSWRAFRESMRRHSAAAAEQEMLLIYSAAYAVESCRDFLDRRGPAAHAVAQRVLKKLT
jgi:glucosyl-dolichyl phosphate glucuronosyltransferase